MQSEVFKIPVFVTLLINPELVRDMLFNRTVDEKRSFAGDLWSKNAVFILVQMVPYAGVLL